MLLDGSFLCGNPTLLHSGKYWHVFGKQGWRQ